MEKSILLDQLHNLMGEAFLTISESYIDLVNGNLDTTEAYKVLDLYRGTVPILETIVDIHYGNGMQDYEGLCYKLASLNSEE